MATLADVLRQTGYSQDGTLATPTPTQSPMTKVLAEHIASLPQKFAENQQTQMDLLGKAFPGNTYESMMTQGDPKAMAELAMQVPFNAMVAYHGTPHKIVGGFDINKVGTGEGAQAYGHGMYFAESPQVAEQYAKELGAKIDVNGKPLMQQGKIVGSTGNTELDDFLVANLGDVKATRKDLLQSIKEVRPTNPEGAKDYQKLLAELRKSSVGTQNTGNLYKVDIPDEYIPNMLDWDKPLSQQSKSVQDVAWKYKDALIKQTKMTGDKSIWDLDGASLYGVMQRYMPAEKGKVVKQNVDFADVSKNLNELGIKGIRYLDEGSRNQAVQPYYQLIRKSDNAVYTQMQDLKKAEEFVKNAKKQGIDFKISAPVDKRTSNFVVFDPSTVKILEENSKPVSRKALIEQQVKKLKD